ncbi:response regulator [Flavobacterium sp. NST-5]|uniref:histidine kinase n=1 Tax=Flavobacterium ichthyis TaxID=2698827 RepID=A0ABW9ZA05_9FLAO|nr:response regulator [Flavobacterium ichthyis]NBL65723.1 response regulator [Flavobacterium ichthyis]
MILIVDDKSENIIALQKTLELHGLTTDSAESGEIALKKILKNEYSLIILDVQMPGMDGFEVAENLAGSNRTKDIPVLFLSAINKEKKYISKGYHSGGVDYITKPVDPDLLILKVKTFLKLSEQNRELRQTRDILSREITIRKEAQEKLSLQMDELNSVLESLPQTTFTISAEGNIEYVNNRWFQFSHKSDVFPAVHPDDSTCVHKWQVAFESGQEYHADVRIKVLKNNKFRYFSVRIVPIIVQYKIVKWVGTLTDIHEQKRAHENLEEKVMERTSELVIKNEELELSNHELQQFAWVVSHDLKEPLRKIEVFLKLIKDKYLIDSDKAIDYSNRTISAADRMSKLINDLLVYSRLSSKVAAEKTDLNEVLGEVLSDLDYLVEQNNAEISVDELPIVQGVSSQLRQLFQNLIGNSLKFGKENVPIKIDISCEKVASKNFDANKDEHGKFWRITLKDNGIGFDDAYIDKIFIIFQSLNDREKYEGTGIGLAIAKKIVEKHNGIITAKGNLGHGAAFIIILPA